MPKHAVPILLSLIAFVSSMAAVGCGEKDKVLPPEVSKEKIMQGAADRAKPLISILEKTKPEDRQALANMPRMANTLRAASTDPATKKQLDDLGVHVD